MKKWDFSGRVGEMRPSQLMFSYGVGASVDLPHLTVLVMGLDDWPLSQMGGYEISEDRLRLAVREVMSAPIDRLLMPPPRDDEDGKGGAFDPNNLVGVPVAPFPRWMRCPQCNQLARVDSGIFELKTHPFYPDRARYVHKDCLRSYKKSPTVLPARFLLACENGHLDDFPWLDYVHGGAPCRKTKGETSLKLTEIGTAGDAGSVLVICEGCEAKVSMAPAFEDDFGSRDKKGFRCLCRGRQPHLRRFFPGCESEVKTILLGASNSWFPITMSAFSIPVATDALGQLIEDNWAVLDKATVPEVVAAFRLTGQLNAFAAYTDEQIWNAIENKRAGTGGDADDDILDLKTPEWKVFSDPDGTKQSDDFRLRQVGAPQGFEAFFERVVLVERLREVHALLGFTRIDSPNDWGAVAEIPKDRWVPLSRADTNWLPAVEVRGEGVFLQVNETTLHKWCYLPEVLAYDRAWQAADIQWRKSRNLKVPDIVPTSVWSRYVLLHSLSHALMRQLCLECGYTSASIRERIYWQEEGDDKEPMAGILIYTAAPDSEGTLGGLVGLGEPVTLGHHLRAALQEISICASDPLCSEHQPGMDSLELHGSACHACLFSPETSCERGNKFLDRTVLLPTFDSQIPPFFPAHE